MLAWIVRQQALPAASAFVMLLILQACFPNIAARAAARQLQMATHPSCCRLTKHITHLSLQVLACLVENKAALKSDACRKEVFYLEKMEVNDFRIDMALAEACRGDVDKLCKEVQPGEGRVHKCLRDNSAKLSQACK